MLDYFVQEEKYPFFDDLSTLSVIEYFTGAQKDITFDEDSMACVNVAHDKALAKYVSINGLERGNIAVTDRELLLKFLDIASKANYKYLFVDIRFSKTDITPIDSALYNKLLNMKHITISDHHANDDYQIADNRLHSIGGLADYGTTLTTGFSRYQFLQNGMASVPLKMYREIDGNDIYKNGLFYRDKNSSRICYNSPFLPLPESDAESISPDGIRKYRYLGTDIMTDEENEIINYLNGKYVLVGDFEYDLHNTYVGEVPGTVLTYTAYRYLKEGRHIVSYWYFALMMLIYTAMGYFMLSAFNIGLSEKIVKSIDIIILNCLCRPITFIIVSVCHILLSIVKLHKRICPHIEKFCTSYLSPFLIILVEMISSISLTMLGFGFIIILITSIVYEVFGIMIISILPTLLIAISSYVFSKIKTKRL